jgi:hypothetical protein
MPDTKEIGSFFIHAMEYPSTDFPLMERAKSQEIEHPFRVGRSWVIRIPFSREAFVVGRWGPPAEDPDAALQHALRLFQGGDPDVVQEEEAPGA